MVNGNSQHTWIVSKFYELPKEAVFVVPTKQKVVKFVYKKRSNDPKPGPKEPCKPTISSKNSKGTPGIY